MHLSGRRAGLIAVAAVGAAVLTVLVFGRPPTAVLSAASPAQDATVGTLPAAITLTFSVPVAQAHVSVSGTVMNGEPIVDGQTVRQPVRIANGGRYLVLYHVVTQDGSDLYGTTSFTIAGPGIPAGPDPAPPPELPTYPTHHGGPIDIITGIVIGVNVVVLLVFGVLFVIRGRKARRGHAGATTPE